MKYVVPEAVNSQKLSVRYLTSLKSPSRANRNTPTPAEATIWNQLLKNKKTGFRFLRQKPIHRFIIDFYCPELKLAIEIDGSSHRLKTGTDRLRDEFLLKIGIDTIRFTNDEVLHHLDQVKIKLASVLPPLLRGGGPA